jgi:hypothetical protein
MMYLREDGIWEIECSDCQAKLTEAITGPLPINGPAAKYKASKAGWVIFDNANMCAGCVSVY